jgi:hypothetical protein
MDSGINVSENLAALTIGSRALSKQSLIAEEGTHRVTRRTRSITSLNKTTTLYVCTNGCTNHLVELQRAVNDRSGYSRSNA